MGKYRQNYRVFIPNYSDPRKSSTAVLGDQQIETVHPIMTHKYSQYLAYETYMRHIATSGDNESLVNR